MIDPFFDSLATALGGQIAVALGSAAQGALDKVRGLLRRRDDPTTLAALEAAESGAGRPQIEALAERLDQVAQDDPEFGAELREAGAEVHHELSATQNRVVNQNSGTVRTLIQGEQINGDITFN
ncbi:hypothetical protein GCM10027271_25030 [Saccharopolyspora gloriosae]|uniref:Uncharacterized protein n=1 Tax=Saccharopolyspora gloriosae TaxID=455344 RepID=A0A840NMW8_9PSEU|nr:hypothetical protein [Saccharopolyspora gloriosae]MBB5071658.1 hypothetical protein [Saccharopolyspora gloriosae]